MKKETSVIASLSLFGWAVLLLLQTQSHSQQLWGAILTPNGGQQLILYQKERMMHQTPEILLYSQDKEQTEHYLGSINLPEDNRTTINYSYTWLDNQEMILLLECDPCMINERRYRIRFSAQTADCITILPSSI